MEPWLLHIEINKQGIVVYCENYKSTENNLFLISDNQNNISDVYNFINNNSLIVYDEEQKITTILSYIYYNYSKLKNYSSADIINKLYSFINSSIDKSNYVLHFNNLFKTINICELLHWNNLKYIQFSIDWWNVVDLHRTIEYVHINKLISYCRNTVKSVKLIYWKLYESIEQRKQLSVLYNVNLYSANESKIITEILSQYINKQTSVNKNKQIQCNNIILDYIKFDSKEFNELVNNIKNLIIYSDKSKNKFKQTILYKDYNIIFGLGGLHCSNKSGIYTQTDEQIIVSIDVKSFYSSLSLNNKWYPKNIESSKFYELYDYFYKEKNNISNTENQRILYKKLLSLIFGLSYSETSILYDIEYATKIIINGQLLLLLLIEMLFSKINDIKIIMINTDGAEFIINNKDKSLFDSICKKWSEITKLTLKKNYYQKVFLFDCNNYIAIYDWQPCTKQIYDYLQSTYSHWKFKIENQNYYYAKTKCTGRFEFYNLPIEKNKSYLVIRKAIYNYLVHNKNYKEEILNNKNIFDFCGIKNVNENWYFLAEIDVNYKLLPNTIRYYVSNNGYNICKINPTDGSKVNIETGKYLFTLCHEYNGESIESFDINYTYYIKRVTNEINKLTKSKASSNMDEIEEW